MLGVYDINGYARGRILWKGLQSQKIPVDIVLPKTRKYLAIAKRLLKKDFDIILATGKLVLLTAWLMKWWHRKPIVFDVFISDYDTMVIDRKLVKPGSLKAKLLWFGDRWSCKIADHIIHDTEEHIDYFVDEFSLSREKFEEVLIGADDEIFAPLAEKPHKGFRVLFHGTFIPLQGIPYILNAAKTLEAHKDISFDIIGAGQTFDEMKTLAHTLRLTNIIFHGMKRVEQLPSYYEDADVGLGIFGDTPKTLRVIPNKAYEILAMKRALISGDTPPMRRWLADGTHALLCKVADAQTLANAILALKKDAALRSNLAEQGYQQYVKTSSNAAIGIRLNGLFSKWIV